MNHKQFFNLVAAMRESQRLYFRTRSGNALTKSKELEKRVDNEITRVKSLLADTAEAQQGTLFGQINTQETHGYTSR